MPDRLLHPLRRRVARRILQRRVPARVLVVCYGNICRSPYAAAVLSRALSASLPRPIRVDSAGLIGENRPPPDHAIAAASGRGLDLSGHRSARLSVQSVAAAELILVMEPFHRSEISGRFGTGRGKTIILGDLDPAPIDRRGIRDPIHGSREVFEWSYARIDRCIDVLVRNWADADRFAVEGAPGVIAHARSRSPSAPAAVAPKAGTTSIMARTGSQ